MTKKMGNRLPGLVGPPDYDEWIEWRAELDKKRGPVKVNEVPQKQKTPNKGIEKLKKINHVPWVKKS